MAVVRGVWASEPASIVLAAALMAAALAVHRSRMNAARRAALRATGLVALALAGGAVARLAVEHGAGTPTLLIYELSLVAVAVLLAASMARRTGEQAALADLVIELGSRPSGVLRDALAQTLGDPTVEVGFRLDDGATFVDAQGTPLALPHADPQRAVTFVEREGERIAALVHDPAVLRDFALVDALGTATDLAARNARLQAAVRAQLEELAVSTRRLVEVADVERRRLELRLREGPERRLQTIADELSRVDGPQAQRASEQLSAAFEDLHELAAGLHPRILSEKGLAGAVRELAARTPLTVDVAASAGPHPQAVESVAYFVCAEGLSNVVKYAGAATAAIEIRERDGLLTVVVSDDGAGGADASRGTGLRGLADRVAALGGSLEVESPPGAGTRLAVELPVSRS
ncbi:MAG: hypothetical protein QOH46_1748 [Solirubrobacteraceae bacterium]|nr:hypothetical protein [Solirubrobacteraceae bacterium]